MAGVSWWPTGYRQVSPLMAGVLFGGETILLPVVVGGSFDDQCLCQPVLVVPAVMQFFSWVLPLP